jgi:mono/diheme cytochrome c family protein
MNRRSACCAALLALGLSALAMWPAAAQVPSPPFNLARAEVIAAGETLFNRSCAGKCHGLDAFAGEDAPSLRERSYLTPVVAYIMITWGRPMSSMTAWKDRLPDEDIWRLAAYVSSLQKP